MNMSYQVSESLNSLSNQIDEKFGFYNLNDSQYNEERIGWLLNIHPTTVEDKETHEVRSSVEYYFIEENGSTFKVTSPFYPYFYVCVTKNRIRDVETFLLRKFENLIYNISIISKVDLDMKDHLIGAKGKYLKLEFLTVQDLLLCRKDILPIVEANKSTQETDIFYNDDNVYTSNDDISKFIEDIREYDVPYYERTMIDTGIRVANWYLVKIHDGHVTLKHLEEKIGRPKTKVLAFDIETTKLPLRFPNPEIDSVMMISYMIDNQGYLIVNREIVTEDIDDFEYTPKPEMKGPFICFNEKNELDTLNRFVNHIIESKPNIFVTFNGDNFDWAFLEKRYKKYNIPLSKSIGLTYSKKDEFYSTRYAPHLDVYHWVRRDSYLPQGSQGLKAVTKAKLGYNPLEIDPELMMQYSIERPIEMAQYSVSDAVATYYLYMKYVHPFIFSLCSIIPMNPDDVLRKGTGTLCESLLMVESYKANIIFPNKHKNEFGKMFDEHIIESETYIGGHVEALSTGIYRSDIPIDFKMKVNVLESMKKNIDETMKFFIEKESNLSVDDVENYDEVKAQIIEQLDKSISNPKKKELPLIYHVDVAAMYPNIILTNRLQPSAIVNDRKCSSCVYNNEENRCKRRMEWDWRVEYFPSKRGEYEQIKSQLELEMHKRTYDFEHSKENFNNKKMPESVSFNELSESERVAKIRARLKEYCKNVYKKSTETKVVNKKEIICMRENPFYVDTVRAFRDRRYIYRTKAKEWGVKLETLKKNQIKDPSITDDDIEEATNMVVLYDSLQLAHKCILNSFYGYVMRKGARWFSMEMAGIVTATGAAIIKSSREIIEGIGKVLELDTDGIWCCIPSSFPDKFTFTHKNGKKLTFSFICTVLNTLVHKLFSNDQYQHKDEKENKYRITKECTIFFEVDGPYKAMFLPTSTEEGKQLKKRYAIFDDNDRLVELKGFELKRRGELKIIKDFQSQIFSSFLKGKTIEEIYESAASIANYYLDIIDTKGSNMRDEELIQLICESRSMSKSIHEYGNKKSTAITTSRRLAELLGDQSLQVKGLTCRFVVSMKPEGKQIAERAIPIEVFSSDIIVQRKLLRKWTGDKSLYDVDIRSIVDWDYYKTRLSTQFQKIITIPAYYQGVKNPLPRVSYPEWLNKKIKMNSDGKVQLKLSEMMKELASRKNEDEEEDIEEDDSDREDDDDAAKSDVGDIEDFGIPTVRGDIRFRSTRKKRERVNENSEERNVEDIPEVIPDEKENPTEWLMYQKKKWRRQIEERKKRKKELGNNSILDVRSGNAISNAINRMNLSILKEPWQILQIKRTKENGIFKVWFITGNNRMTSTLLKINRRFYINSYKEREGNKICHHFLPRMRKSHYLYEINLDENDYQKKKVMIEIQKSSSDIEGLYESQVPLDFYAILDLGCVCTVKENSRGHDLNLPWSLNQLQRIQPSSKAPYIESRPRLVFLYQTGPQHRSFFGIYDQENEKMIIVYVSSREQDDIRPALSKMNVLHEYYKKKKKKDPSSFNIPVNESINSFDDNEFTNSLGDDISESDKIEFDLIRKNTFDAACKHINSIISKIIDSNQSPMLLFTQTLLSYDEILNYIPSIDNTPTVQLSFHNRDAELAPISWLLRAGGIFVQRSLAIEKWYERTYNLSKYSEVPIGNMNTDYALFLSDVFFSRKLKENDHILWYSDSIQPDLGGNEDEDHFFSLDIENPEYSNPDCIETVTIDMDIQGLAINSIIHSSYIKDLDYGLLMLDNPNLDQNSDIFVGASQDETLSCAYAFKILKQLVTGWLHDSAFGINASNLFVDSVYRWISSVNSKLYDPALHKLIHKLIHKVFTQLLTEFTKLGSKIIYATFNRIIIATEKKTYKDAVSYFNFISDALKKIKLFSFIDIVNPKYYHVLLFKDIYNYVAIEANEDDVLGKKDIVTKSVIHMVDYLPSSIRDHFNFIVYGAVVEIYNQKMKELRKGNHLIIENEEEEELTDSIHNGEIYGSSIVNNIKESDRVVLDFITEKLKLITNDVHKTLSSSDVQNELSHMKNLIHPLIKFDTPSLEFVKTTCFMLSLKKSIKYEIQALKRDLLSYLDVEEYSDEAEFRDPVVSYVLSNVICGYCNDCRDIDMLRDPSIMNHQWKCPRCQSTYDKDAIEQRLVDIVQKKVLAYKTQDIICKRCNEYVTERLSKISPCCSYELENTESREEFIFTLHIFENISKYHKMSFLNDVVNFLLYKKYYEDMM